MVIVSAKVSKRKILAAITAALCVIALLVILLQHADAPGQEPTPAAPSLEAGSNEERLSYLASFGWQVQPEPSQTQEVRIPETFNDVFTRYNELQKSQGFDLSSYAGKAVKRYVYPILNHPMGEGYAATVLVSRGKIIGGDVSGAAQGSPIQGFAMPG